MTAETYRDYMELVRETWLQCRGPQRVYAKAILDRYDMGRRQRRGEIRHSLGVILTVLVGIILLAMVCAGGC